MFQFGAFPIITDHQGEVPFGNPGFIGSMHLPRAYRSSARPSSALEPSHSPDSILPVFQPDPVRLDLERQERMVSERGLNTSLPWCLHPVSIKPVLYRNPQQGLFLSQSSSLDAFSSYSLARSCPAMPCQTTGTPVAPLLGSSRTKSSLPADLVHLQQIVTDLSHDGLNPAHDLLQQANNLTLGRCCTARMERTDIEVASHRVDMCSCR
eukprot:TRINITY_DN6262_c0_g1_i4.p1 TRINITY_DN6262_c0_g1~~TRINITY_DN6262_c0_g1_i4.p1  ORF type:complete len:209 (+),score=-31.33 TRINITY_DN6262_c0_g1_i4:74-700(+)